MALQRFTLNYGKGTLSFGLPEEQMLGEIAGFVQPDFLVNIVPTLEGGVAGVLAGNWASAWQAATRLVDRIFGVPQASLTLPIPTANHA